MKKSKENLSVERIDRKLKEFKTVEKIIKPNNGWIYAVRKALNMSLRQLGLRLNIAPQSVRRLEYNEANGLINIKSLSRVAEALDMKLVYGFVSKHESLEDMIEKRAYELAKEIVLETSSNMALEDQKNSNERLEKSIKEMAIDIKRNLKELWD